MPIQKWEHLFLTGAFADAGHGIPVVKLVNGRELEDWKKKNWYMDDALNQYGQHGWELVTVVWRTFVGGNSLDPVYILKRPCGVIS